MSSKYGKKVCTCTQPGLPKILLSAAKEKYLMVASKIPYSSCPYIPWLVPNTCGFVWRKSKVFIDLWILNNGISFTQYLAVVPVQLSSYAQLHPSPSEKWSGEQSWIFFQIVLQANEIVRLSISRSSSPKAVNFCFATWVSNEQVMCKLFTKDARICYSQKACASPKNLTWLTRPFILPWEKVGSQDETNFSFW